MSMTGEPLVYVAIRQPAPAGFPHGCHQCNLNTQRVTLMNIHSADTQNKRLHPSMPVSSVVNPTGWVLDMPEGMSADANRRGATIALLVMLEAFAGDAHDDQKSRIDRKEQDFQGLVINCAGQILQNRNGDPKAAESCQRERADCITGSSCLPCPGGSPFS